MAPGLNKNDFSEEALRNTLVHFRMPEGIDDNPLSEDVIRSTAAVTPLLQHPSMLALGRTLKTAIPQLFEYLFVKALPYDTICFCSKDWKTLEDPSDYGTYQSRNDLHLLLYLYILKRYSSIMILESESYKINHDFSTKTDAAFINFVNIFISSLHGGVLIADVGLKDIIRNIPGYGRTVMIGDEGIHRAFKVFTEQPMKFFVHSKDDANRWRKEEIALFWHKNTEPKGSWDTEWDVMSKSHAWIEHADANYGFEQGAGDKWEKHAY